MVHLAECGIDFLLLDVLIELREVEFCKHNIRVLMLVYPATHPPPCHLGATSFDARIAVGIIACVHRWTYHLHQRMVDDMVGIVRQFSEFAHLPARAITHLYLWRGGVVGTLTEHRLYLQQITRSVLVELPHAILIAFATTRLLVGTDKIIHVVHL